MAQHTPAATKAAGFFYGLGPASNTGWATISKKHLYLRLFRWSHCDTSYQGGSVLLHAWTHWLAIQKKHLYLTSLFRWSLRGIYWPCISQTSKWVIRVVMLWNWMQLQFCDWDSKSFWVELWKQTNMFIINVMPQRSETSGSLKGTGFMKNWLQWLVDIVVWTFEVLFHELSNLTLLKIDKTNNTRLRPIVMVSNF